MVKSAAKQNFITINKVKWIDGTQIEFTYQHLNQSLENRLGRCCTTFSLEESKLVGHEKWQWLDTLEQGSSLIREI